VNVGLRHLDRFAWVVGFSSSLRGTDSELAAVLADADGVNAKLRLLWIGCGKDDRIFDNSEQFVKLLNEKQVKHVWHPSAGGHTWSVWRRYLHEVMPRLFAE
jgi:enterochelin esterase family protein